MDCVDCHNRPTHTFHVPEKAIDWIIDTHPELRDLPYYKKQAVKAIKGEYDSHAEGMAAVSKAMTSYYTTDHPDVVAEISEPRKIPTTNIHSQSIFGTYLIK